MRTFPSVWLAIAVMALGLTGCAQSRNRTAMKPEPPLLTGVDGEALVVEAPAVRPVTAADRHPLLRRPREYYDQTNGNKFSKTAAAAVIGVPSGIVAEMKQIVTGQPAVNRID